MLPGDELAIGLGVVSNGVWASLVSPGFYLSLLFLSIIIIVVLIVIVGGNIIIIITICYYYGVYYVLLLWVVLFKLLNCS